MFSGDRPMRAAVLYGHRDLRVEDRPTPEPTGTEVLVEVAHCGICGTDLHMVLDGWGIPGSVGGHEWSGRVAAVGARVERFAVGDAVVGGATPACGTCAMCKDTRPSLCLARQTPGTERADGAFAEYVCVDEQALVAVPDPLDLRTAAVAEPLAVALHAVNRGRVEAGQRVFVSGAGPVGALVILALRARGVTEIVVSEPNPTRRALAAKLGATTTVDPLELDVPTIAEPRRVVDTWAHVALECSGHARAIEAACAQLGVGGRLVLVGSGMTPPRLDANRILLNELTITGAFEYDADGIPAALDLLAYGAVDVGGVVEAVDVPLTGLFAALEALAGGEIAGKVLVNPRLEAS